MIEQDLNLSPEETERLLKALRNASLPENRKYRYNYIRDNCSTRIIGQIDNAASETIIYPDTVEYGTFRNEMRAYHKNYPWYQFGIDLALGSGLDHPLTSREEMFVPVELMKKARGAVFKDGRPLVKTERVLNEGSDKAVEPPTYWAFGPLFCCCLVAAIAIAVCIYEFKTGRIIKSFNFIWFFVLGLAGCLIAFLVFISVHAATSPNALIFWLNPFQWLMCIGLSAKKFKLLSQAMAWYNLVGVGALMIAWGFITQSANPAFYPLMGATVILGGSYAIIARKSSYNNNGHKRKPNVAKKKK